MRKTLLPLLLVAVTLGCYGHLFLGRGLEFVFDDIRFVEENKAIQELRNLPSFFTDPTTIDPYDWGGIYRPIRTLDFALDWAIAGARPWWFHLRNAIYHSIAALLVLALLRRWGAGSAGAALGAFVFALHPTQVEAVGWITSRGDLLYLVFFLAALLMHQRSEGYGLSFLGTLGFYLLALFSKEAAVVFPGAVLLADFFFRDKRKLRNTFRLARWPKYAIYAALAVAYYLLWRHLQSASGEELAWHIKERWGGSFLGTVLTMSRGFVYYAKLIVLPVGLAQDWYLTPANGPDLLTLVCLATVGGLLVWSLVRMFRGGGTLAFAVLWFGIAIFPVSNLPGPIGIPTAERFLYLPLVGVALACGTLLARLWARGRAGQALVIAALACLLVGSIHRGRIWVSEGALWGDAMERTGELTWRTRFSSPRAYDRVAKTIRLEGEDLGREMLRALDEDDLEKAAELDRRSRALLEKSIEFLDLEAEIWQQTPDPSGSTALPRSAKALCLFDLGRSQEALDLSDQVLRDWYDLGPGHYARALALLGLGRTKEAAVEIEIALDLRESKRVKWGGAMIYRQLGQQYNLKQYYNLIGNRARAFQCLRRSWQLLPSETDNGGVFTAMMDMEKELREKAVPLQEKVRKNPSDGDAWFALASVLSSFGEWQEAGKAWDWLLENIPDRPAHVLFPYALYHWEWRDTKEGYEKAAEIYGEILQNSPDLIEARKGLERCLE